MASLVSHPDEVKVVSRRFGQGAANLDRYLELDGYNAVRKALAMEPDAIINEVKNSSLRGRGGAGFSAGMKWSFVPKQSAKPKYVLCNGDESEPGTCKDRLIFEHDPHSVIEGVVIAGLAVGATSGYIYIRGEYRYLSIIMQKAIRDAYARGFLGKNIFGSGRNFDAYWHGGAGAYEVGEESALMESLEGKRGIPRIRPPFPAVVGLWGGPTVINNAETLASVPHIILGGADWYAKLGPPKNGGRLSFGEPDLRRAERRAGRTDEKHAQRLELELVTHLPGRQLRPGHRAGLRFLRQHCLRRRQRVQRHRRRRL